jgi:hypothetical protein
VNPDDFDIIDKTGLDYRPDTEGGSLGAAETYAVDGVITTAADSDTFTVNRSSCTSDLVVNATGIGMGQTLDIKVTVSGPGVAGTSFDPASGAVGGTPNTPTGMDVVNATISNAAAGTWTVKVEGIGDAAKSVPDYGSVGQYHLTITGCAGSVGTAPSVPTALATQPNLHTTTGSVSWSPPADPGTSPVTSYTVSGVPGGPYVVNAPTTSKSLTGLVPGTTYTVSVTASSIDGTSPAATKSLRVPTWAPTAAPVLTVTANTPTSNPRKFDVEWPTPANPGNATPNGWYMTLYDASHDVFFATPQPPDATGSSIGGLPPGAYSIEVYQKVTSDDGATSATASKSFTLGPKVPTAPKIGTPSSGVTGGSVNAVARWAAPTSNGGAAITGYRVIAYKSTFCGSVFSATVSKLLSSTARSYTFPLPAGRYKFRVVAYNAIGRSPYSLYSALVYAR